MSVKDRRVSRESRGWSTPLQPQGTPAPKATQHSQEVMQNEPKEKESELQSKRLFISVRSHQPGFTLQQMEVCTRCSPSPKVWFHLCVCRPALLLTTSLQKSLMALRHAFVLHEARYSCALVAQRTRSRSISQPRIGWISTSLAVRQAGGEMSEINNRNSQTQNGEGVEAGKEGHEGSSR